MNTPSTFHGFVDIHGLVLIKPTFVRRLGTEELQNGVFVPLGPSQDLVPLPVVSGFIVPKGGIAVFQTSVSSRM